MRDLLMLLASGSFYSGSELGRQLGISRAAVWKRIQRINEEFGLSVQSVPGKGYRLAQPLQLLDEEVIKLAFPSLPVFIYESVGSTNDQAKLLLTERSAPLVVLAEHQTQGKGRRGREWVSPFAQNVYLSYVLPINQGLNQIDGLSLVVGLAVAKAVKKITGVNAGLKWPNDVLIDESKVAGILLELVGDPVELCHVIIGVGVNLNMLDAFASIDQQWTSLSKETGKIVDRTSFAKTLIEEIDICLDQHNQHGFSSLRQQWLELHAWQNRNVLLHMGQETVAGVVTGIGNKGELCLLIDGEERNYIGGELSLRLNHDT